MPEKKTTADVLTILAAHARRIEKDAGQIAAVLEKLLAAQQVRQAHSEQPTHPQGVPS